MSKKSSLPIVVVLIVLAFALRVYRLEVSPLRGDEAFAIRYWAAPPADVLSHLVWVEPHPFGTFFGFWIWKSLVGSSEFAMRMLPALINLLGVPAMYALGRRLFHDQIIGLVGAFLWAINPNLIWHSQDVRNYAIWAGLSAVSMWLLLRAAHRSRWIDWMVYIVFQTITLYVFFLEVFIVAVQLLYILIFWRKALRPWITAMLVVGILLIPWFGQIWALAHSGYGGAATGADLGKLVSQFWPSLMFSEIAMQNTVNSSGTVLPVLIVALFAICLMWLVRVCRTEGGFLALWLAVPAGLLTVAASRVNVFLPRYLIAVTPALLLTLAWLAVTLYYQVPRRVDLRDPVRALGTTSGFVLLGTSAVLTVFITTDLGSFNKAPDWYSLRDYLDANTTSADAVIMTSLDPQTGNADPAFEYYYNGPAKVITLPHPGFDVNSVIQKALDESRAVWFVVSGSDTRPINDALLRDGVLISDDGAGRSFLVRQYRAKSVKLAQEVGTRLRLRIGDAVLYGFSITGEARTGSQLTVLLFWEQPPTTALTIFLHLIGPMKSDGSPLWTQDDHPYIPLRDVYHLQLSLVPPGEYIVEFGLYDARTGKRVPITDLTTGKAPGGSYNLTTISIRDK